MLRKQIEDMMTVTLRYFFDIDYSLFNHSFLVVFVIGAGFFRLAFQSMQHELMAGVKTVKKDYFEIRHDLDGVKKWCVQQSFYTTIIGNYRVLRELFNKYTIDWK
jgi:hypothetical protein